MKRNFFIILFVCCFLTGHAQITKESKWRLNLSGGMGYRTIDTSEDESKMTDIGFSAQKVKDFDNDLKWGLQGNGDVHYLFHPNFGAGIKYAFFYADGKFDEISTLIIPSVIGESSTLKMKIREKDYLNYVGPSLHARAFLEKTKFAVSATLSGGYAHYRSDGEITRYLSQHILYDERLIIRGNSFGMYAGVGLEYFFNKRLAMGFDFGYFHSSINDVTVTARVDESTTVSKKVKLKDIDGKAENLSRIDFSLGIKIYL